MAYKITINRDQCIGCGTCAAMCEENFEIDSDNLARVKRDVVDDLGCNIEAAENCPVGCIKVEEIGDE